MSAKAAAALAAVSIPDEARAVAGMMALPIDYPPVRVADTYSADETALAQVVTKKKVSWDSGLNIGQVASGRQLPSNDWGAFIFPSLLRHTVVYKVLVPGVAPIIWQYKAVKGVAGASTSFSVPSYEGTWRMDPGGMIAFLGEQPHGSFMFCGRAEGRTGFWVDAMSGYPATISVNFSQILPVGASVTLVLYRWNNGRWNLQSQGISSNPASTVFTSVNNSGYYAVELNLGGVNSASTGTAEILMQCTTTSSWAHMPVNDIYSNYQNIGNERVLGLAFLLQNEASVMNKQGNVVAWQIPPNQDWYITYAGKGGGAGFYDDAFQDKSSSTFLLETGIYGFKRPKGSQDFNWEQEIFHNEDQGASGIGFSPADEVRTGFFNLECPCDYLGIAASASQVGAADCLLSTAVGLEYTTTNPWLDTQTPVIAKQAFELGIASLREVEQFYENPIHIPSLMDAISNGMSAVAPLVGFIPGIGPALAAGAMTGGQVVRSVRNAIYGDADANESQQGENRQIQKRQKRVKRMAELETVVANGSMGSRYRRRPSRRL
jgi:hypothetical protein